MSIDVIEFTYTLSDLQELRQCIKANGGVLSAAFRAFMVGRGLYMQPWLEFAEQILKDERFPENHFAKTE